MHRRNRFFLKSVFLVSVLILSFPVAENIHSQEQGIDLFPSKWVRLTEVEGEWVIYHYCFAGIATIQLNPTENDGAELIVFSGQDSETYDVVDKRHTDDAVILHVKNHYEGIEKDIVFRYVDSSHRIGEWEGLYSGFPAVRSILSAYETDVRHDYENNGNCDPN